MENSNRDVSSSSQKSSYPVIPTPLRTRWREFRIKFIPALVFCMAILMAGLIWQEMPLSSGVRGIGDGAVSLVTSPQDGFLTSVAVEPHGWAEAGKPILTIVPFDPQSRLDILQSQLQLSRLGLEPSVADRNVLNYEQLRVDLLRLRQELAMAQANLERAEKVLPRHEALLKEKLLARDVYDLTVRDRDFYQAEVKEKTKAIEEIQGRLESLRAMSDPSAPGSNPLDNIIPDLEAQMTAVQTNWNPVTLQAPISGSVQFYRHAGEFVRAGDPILVINSPRAERIVAYLKQPFPFEPQVGATMEVVTRSTKPQRFLTEIMHIGSRMEVITNALAYVPAGALVDTGLPVIMPVPEDIQVRPGEVVDLVWRPGGTNETFISRLFRN